MTSAERSLHPSYLLDQREDASVSNFLTDGFVPALKANPAAARADLIRTLSLADVKDVAARAHEWGRSLPPS